MQPALANAPSSRPGPPRAHPTALLSGFLASLTARGAGNTSYTSAARAFLARWPYPQAWTHQPLQTRLAANSATRPLLTYLMLNGHLRPGYDYLLERKLSSLLREAKTSPLSADLARFLTAATELGYSPKIAAGMASQVTMRLLIQTGRALLDLTDTDLDAFTAAVTGREQARGKRLRHYHHAVYATRTVIYHLGAAVTPTGKNGAAQPWGWPRHFHGINATITASLVSYLECAAGTRARSTVSAIASRLAHFARFLSTIDAGLSSLADLDRQRHIEPYLASVAAARHPRTGAPLSTSERRSRILTVARMIDDIIEWGWAEAPTRRLVFARDVPRLPRALPRYLPPDADQRLARALRDSPHRLRADALLLLRATGMRIGELRDLELDCVHEVPDAGAWLKVPLGKLDTERMVPLDDDTLDLIDRIVAHRSPGRPLPHPRTGKLADFLLTHQGRRISVDTLRDELTRTCAEAGLPATTPHQLRHTYATALINAGVSLQALMALLGHVSAEMSLRYGRLFDTTVRSEYERALQQAKQRFGQLIPETAPADLAATSDQITDWRHTPLIKARLASGHCLRTEAQGACSYANICEHCPNLRTDATSVPVLAAQRADAETLAADAATRGWDTEVNRHRRLIDRIDTLINRTAP